MIFATGVWIQCSKTLGRDGFKVVLLTLALSHIVVDWSWWFEAMGGCGSSEA